ncbi:MAG: phosphate/phosphite/phosphonate ABC transporter substrate-binding protein [Deltaproteobacteria bacterium]|nr:phosphate/phosphite/phosphonate ABC transporter substrate-binding protein [Deltaproteobacteria bacterium]MBW2070890.1 phosphate/phosphite/phosphonate ABC transporter substrate-binding protein [Deltaproteobacteria bacterium]
MQHISPATFLISSSLLAVSLLFSLSCSRDVDSHVVDFSKTMQVERPGESTSPKGSSLRVAVGAMISPRETFAYYHRMLDYIGRRLHMEVELVQRKTYAEVNELFARGQVDVGFICSGPYALSKATYGFEPLATPLVHGQPSYQAYLIVNRESTIYRLEDLRGRVFAFTDPQSNTGKLVPTYWVTQLDEQPETFFARTIYTYSHDNAIIAVSKELVDGAAVDSLIWEYYNHKRPELTSRTRIIRKSTPYGIPPLVCSSSLPAQLKGRIRQVLFAMHGDPEGQTILSQLMIDRFVPVREEWYETIRDMKKKLASPGNRLDATSKTQE